MFYQKVFHFSLMPHTPPSSLQKTQQACASLSSQVTSAPAPEKTALHLIFSSSAKAHPTSNQAHFFPLPASPLRLHRSEGKKKEFTGRSHNMHKVTKVWHNSYCTKNWRCFKMKKVSSRLMHSNITQHTQVQFCNTLPCSNPFLKQRNILKSTTSITL